MAWTVTCTVRVRLDVPDDRKGDLHATNRLFQHCANRTNEWAWRYPNEDCVTNKRAAEEALYHDLREETDQFHSNLVQKAIKRAMTDVDNAVDRLAAAEPVSRPEYDTFSIVYDKRAATFHRNRVRLATPHGRVDCEYILPDTLEGDATRRVPPERGLLVCDQHRPLRYGSRCVLPARDHDTGIRR